MPPGVEFSADSPALRRAAGAPALGGGGRRSGSRGGHSFCSLFHLPLTSRPLIYIRARAPPAPLPPPHPPLPRRARARVPPSPRSIRRGERARRLAGWLTRVPAPCGAPAPPPALPEPRFSSADRGPGREPGREPTTLFCPPLPRCPSMCPGLQLPQGSAPPAPARPGQAAARHAGCCSSCGRGAAPPPRFLPGWAAQPALAAAPAPGASQRRAQSTSKTGAGLAFIPRSALGAAWSGAPGSGAPAASFSPSPTPAPGLPPARSLSAPAATARTRLSHSGVPSEPARPIHSVRKFSKFSELLPSSPGCFQRLCFQSSFYGGVEPDWEVCWGLASLSVISHHPFGKE